jgi:RecA-family ATPase
MKEIDPVDALIDGIPSIYEQQTMSPPPVNGAEDYGFEMAPESKPNNVAKFPTKTPPLPWLDLPAWDSQPVPEREWLVRDRIPLRQPTLLSGEGAVGKSLLALHLLTAVALARDWIGTLPEQGGAWYVGAEDDERELHIRLAAIRKYFGISFADLTTGGFRMSSLFARDAILGAPNRNGLIEPTDLYRRLIEEAADTKPKCIALDASADLFGGSENDRAQVRQFVALLRRLAAVSDGAVLLLSHPSLTGINSGSGISGTTAWHNSVRARMYLTSIKAEAGEQPDTDLRELIFKKSNYSRLGDSVLLRYRDGLFLPEAGTSSLDRAAREQSAEQVFLELLARFDREGRNASDRSRSNGYAPSAFSHESEAKAAGLRKADLEGAMRRLFESKKIHAESYGKKSNPHYRLRRGAKEDDADDDVGQP